MQVIDSSDSVIVKITWTSHAIGGLINQAVILTYGVHVAKIFSFAFHAQNTSPAFLQILRIEWNDRLQYNPKYKARI